MGEHWEAWRKRRRAYIEAEAKRRAADIQKRRAAAVKELLRAAFAEEPVSLPRDSLGVVCPVQLEKLIEFWPWRRGWSNLGKGAYRRNMNSGPKGGDDVGYGS